MMGLIRKTIPNKILEVQRYFCASRMLLHLTDADKHDTNVIKSDQNFVIPGYNIPEVLVPKFQDYQNYTAVVSFSFLSVCFLQFLCRC